MQQIKSKKRVKEFGEVFTAEREVKAMCDLIPADIWDNISSTFLEPACGTGNFLVEIFARKLELCNTIDEGLIALKSIYGIDILSDNVETSKKRLFEMFCRKFTNDDRAIKILNENIICGDSLKIMKEWENDL